MEINRETRSHFAPTPVFHLVKTPDWRERLKTAVAKSGKKQSVIARDAGVAPETLSRILNASLPNPSFDVIVRIARAVNENVGWLLDERGFVLTMEEQKQLRDVARILDDTLLTSAASRRDRPESNASLSTASEIPRGYAVRGARLAYEAAGDSMTGAGIIDRDVLFVKPTRNTREAAGRVVVCRVEDAEYVRVLDIRAGRTRLISRNERYLPIEVGEGSRFELIGIVVGRTGALS